MRGPFASLKGASRLLPLVLSGCIVQPLPEPPGALEKVAAVDTTKVANPPSVLPPIEPWIPIQK
jgi:hypothetical protein